MSTPHAARQRWMRALALGTQSRLEAAWNALEAPPAYNLLRRPEVGLVMLQGRAGNNGPRFNLGEMSVTRCSVVLQDGPAGHAWIAGRRPRHAELAALFDALMQRPDLEARLEAALIGPLLAEREAELARRAAEVEPTRVNFFTMKRGED